MAMYSAKTLPVDRVLNARIDAGNLPDIFSSTVPTKRDFEDSIRLFDERMPDYRGMLTAEYFGGEIDTLYDPIEDGDWRWLVRTRLYRNTSTKVTVRDNEWVEIRDGFTDALHGDVARLADRLFDRDISLGQWLRQMAKLIKQAHCGAWLLGCGGWNGLTSLAVSDIDRQLRNLYSFLHSYAQEVREGSLEERQLRRAITYRGLVNKGVMFIESMTVSAERGRTMGYGFHPDTLPNYPGDGTTECLTNCRCHWRFRFFTPEPGYYHAFWTLLRNRPDGRNCLTCLRYAVTYNPYSVARF